MSRLSLVFILALTAAAQPDSAAGRRIFESQCALCHGQSGGGGRGPSLARPKLNKAVDDAALRRVITNGIDPEMPGAWQLNPHEVDSVAAYVRSLGSLPQEALPGNPVRGLRVYSNQGCSGCHMVAGKGEGVGPELSDIGARRNAAYLRAAILDPAASLPEDFRYLSVSRATGETIRGIRVNEDTFTIQMKDVRGAFHSFRKSELTELRVLPSQTPMPAYQDRIPAQDLDDLVAYLAGLRGKP